MFEFEPKKPVNRPSTAVHNSACGKLLATQWVEGFQERIDSVSVVIRLLKDVSFLRMSSTFLIE